MMRYIIVMLTLIFTLYPFGKNKVQYHDFDWKVIESEHFKVYYYPENSELAELALKLSERSYRLLRRDFLYEMKGKIDLVLYASHNHFEETNITGSIPEESVGGFTEFFKNRVVIPYDGDWEKFRHVIHHELTHAIQNKFLFGARFQSIVSGIRSMNLPLWFVEGLAEYESRGGWDRDSDMMIRDAVYNNYLPSVNYLSNYMAYKGGQLLLYFISEKYGDKKVSEILRKISVIKSTESAFKDAIGLEYDQLSEEWHRWLMDIYWPLLANTQRPTDIAKQMTDHIENRNFLNNSSALSPDGKKVAYLSNKSDYFDIYLLRTYDGKEIDKIVSGQSSGEFEEFHWLRPGICWSPDSEKIVFAAKSREQDALYIYDALTGDEVEQLKFNLDGIYSPDWSGDGSMICFVGQKDGLSDLYIYNLEKRELSKLTNDIFSVSYPKFSEDGESILFSSDRGTDLNIRYVDRTIDLTSINLNVSDIYRIDIDSKLLTQITNTPDDKENFPFWIDGNRIGYTSDKSGVSNIYIADLDGSNPYPVTDLISGAIQPSSNGRSLTFTSFFKGGYDIYFVDEIDKLKNTDPKNSIWYSETDFSQVEVPYNKDSYNSVVLTEAIENITFTPNLIEEVEKKEEERENTPLFTEKNYSPQFSPDIITANAGYASNYGFAGQIYFQISDKLSKHRFNVQTALSQDIVNSSFNAMYTYLPHRVDFGVGISHDLNYLFTDHNSDDKIQDNEVERDRFFSTYFVASYGMSRYSRFDGFFSLRHIINQQYLGNDEFEYNGSHTIPVFNFGYSYDNTIWGIVGPENGMRARVDFLYSPDAKKVFLDRDDGFEFFKFEFDLRKYFRVYGDYQFAFRAAGGLSGGKTPQKFYLGGVSSWLNYKVKSRDDINDVSSRYYSTVAHPLRGTKIYEREGNRYFVINSEFRFPLINYLSLGFPPINLGYIRGAVFSDFGAAWDDNNFRGYGYSDGRRGLNDLVHTVGTGSRVNLGIFILRYDVAWNMMWGDGSSQSLSDSKPRHILSLGANF
jgi:Tol biopolymer transport system component